MTDIGEFLSRTDVVAVAFNDNARQCNELTPEQQDRLRRFFKWTDES